jgi:hypothetical protein
MYPKEKACFSAEDGDRNKIKYSRNNLQPRSNLPFAVLASKILQNLNNNTYLNACNLNNTHFYRFEKNKEASNSN